MTFPCALGLSLAPCVTATEAHSSTKALHEAQFSLIMASPYRILCPATALPAGGSDRHSVSSKLELFKLTFSQFDIDVRQLRRKGFMIWKKRELIM